MWYSCLQYLFFYIFECLNSYIYAAIKSSDIDTEHDIILLSSLSILIAGVVVESSYHTFIVAVDTGEIPVSERYRASNCSSRLIGWKVENVLDFLRIDMELSVLSSLFGSDFGWSKLNLFSP